MMQTGIGIGLGLPFLDGSAGGTQYFSFPGTTGNTLTCTMGGSITDPDVRAHINPTTWTPSVTEAIASTTNFRAQLMADGKLRVTKPALADYTSTVAVPFSDGDAGHVRFTFDVDNGASGSTATFYTSTDGLSWDQLGDAVVHGATTVANNTSLTVGSIGSSNSPYSGKLYRLRFAGTIDGADICDIRAEDATAGESTFTENSVNAVTVTINQSGDPALTVETE